MDAPPVQYVTTSDGCSIAYCVEGAGLPWVIVAPGFHHLHVMLEEDALRQWISGLAARYTLVRFDARGTGMSIRGLPPTHQMEDLTRDLEAVLDRLNLPPVVLHGIGSSAHTAVRYAASHPDRVRALVLVHCSLTSGPWPFLLMDTVASADWELFLETMAGPGRLPDAARATKQRLRQMVTKDDFAARFRAYQNSRIDDDLSRLKVPTLVLHLQGVQRPSVEETAAVAARIADARFVEISGEVGPWFWGDFDSAIGPIESLIAGLPDQPQAIAGSVESTSMGSLSRREVEVLRLLAAGRSNQQIADELVIGLNTVRRHVSNVFDKTGVANRTEAAVYARDHGIA